MAQDKLIQRLDEYLLKSRLSDRAASLAAEAGVDFIRDLRRRGKRVPPGDKLARVERAIGAPKDYLLSAVDELSGPRASLDTNPTPMARRFRATRLAAYSTVEIACAALGIRSSELAAIEAGKVRPPDDLIMKFCALNGVPLRWIEAGVMDGLPAVLAARVGLFDEGLVPPLREEENQMSHSARQARDDDNT